MIKDIKGAITNKDIVSAHSFKMDKLNLGGNKLLRSNMELSNKHKEFCDNYIKRHGNQTKAYLDTYPDSAENSARANSSRLITNDNIKTHITALMEEKTGLQIGKVLDKLSRLSEAQKPVIVNKIVKSYPDHSIQLESLKVILKLYGLLTPQAQGSQVDARSITFNISDSKDLERLEGIIDRLEALEHSKTRISGKFINRAD